MSQSMTTKQLMLLLILSPLIFSASCTEDQKLPPEGIYGHPSSEDDQLEIPDNQTPIDFLKDPNLVRLVP